MQTDEERLAWLATASYRELLYKWRFEPTGSKWFQDKVGRAFGDALHREREKIGREEAARISKEVGWG
jgi:hypothetical protein